MPPENEDFDPAQNATASLLRHITEKGFQAGSCIGTFVVVPLTAYRGRRSGLPVLPKLLSGLSKSAVITSAVTGAAVMLP